MIFRTSKQDKRKDQINLNTTDQTISQDSISNKSIIYQNHADFITNSPDLMLFNEADFTHRLSLVEEKLEMLNAMFLDVCSNDRFNEMLTTLCDYKSLFSMLHSASRRYMVIISVRDTPGDNLPDLVLDAILRSGFTKFRKDLWYTYVGVVNKGKVIFNEGNFNEKKTCFNYSSLDGNFELSVRSESWRNGDSGEIIINGKKIGCNLRGVNVVIYDTANSKTIISFALDSHELKPPKLKIINNVL